LYDAAVLAINGGALSTAMGIEADGTDASIGGGCCCCCWSGCCGCVVVVEVVAAVVVAAIVVAVLPRAGVTPRDKNRAAAANTLADVPRLLVVGNVTVEEDLPWEKEASPSANMTTKGKVSKVDKFDAMFDDDNDSPF
jgi:hypothetical protein